MYSRNPRRCLALLLALSVFLAMPHAQIHADDPEAEPPQGRVEVTVQIPAKLASFDNTAIVATLFEYDPRLADVGATPVDRLVIRHLGHQQGVEQVLRFTIGDKLGVVRDDRRYYISCRIYEDAGEETFKQGKQVHYCHNEHDRLPGTVYDGKNGKQVAFVAR